MNAKTHTEIVWLNASSGLSIQELIDSSELSKDEIYQYVEEGVIMPIDPHAPQLIFSSQYTTTLRAARRLRDDFELDTQGLAVVITLLKRIHHLEEQLQQKPL